MSKSLAKKLKQLAGDSACKEFILADAKDADMAFGLSAPGLDAPNDHGKCELRSIDQYRKLIRDIVSDGAIDIMLMSVSTSDVLTIGERLFDDSPVTPAVRANDSTDIWLAGGVGSYGADPSQPFRTAEIDHAMFGRLRTTDRQEITGASLGLYSMTFNNDTNRDRQTLEAYREFRLEAERKGFDHFLEVFAPNACQGLSPEEIPTFVNDSIVRALAGVPASARPRFLKIPYFGPAAMEALVSYDSTLVVGIMGGSAGTTLDTFRLLRDAKKYGARAALIGRRINSAEHQVTFVRYLRAIADDELGPEKAVRAYHNELEKLGIRSHRSLEEDLSDSANHC